MIAFPSSVRVWLAVGRTDMRRGMNGLALQVQQSLGRDPHAGDLYVFRGARGDLIKILWHDGVGMSLYAKRLEKERWPGLSEHRFAIYKWKLCRVDLYYAGVWASRKEGVARLERGPDTGGEFFTRPQAAGPG